MFWKIETLGSMVRHTNLYELDWILALSWNIIWIKWSLVLLFLVQRINLMIVFTSTIGWRLNWSKCREKWNVLSNCRRIAYATRTSSRNSQWLFELRTPLYCVVTLLLAMGMYFVTKENHLDDTYSSNFVARLSSLCNTRVSCFRSLKLPSIVDLAVITYVYFCDSYVRSFFLLHESITDFQFERFYIFSDYYAVRTEFMIGVNCFGLIETK